MISGDSIGTGQHLVNFRWLDTGAVEARGFEQVCGALKPPLTQRGLGVFQKVSAWETFNRTLPAFVFMELL